MSNLRNTTPFPNLLIDRVMPFVGDTEWRILNVVVRQTWGWIRQDGQRRESSWISHSFLKRRTGRASAAVSLAVDNLVKRGLIVIRDSNGTRLHKPADRRRSRTKLTYSVHPLFLSSERYRTRIGFGNRNSEGENNKTKFEERKSSGLST